MENPVQQKKKVKLKISHFILSRKFNQIFENLAKIIFNKSHRVNTLEYITSEMYYPQFYKTVLENLYAYNYSRDFIVKFL